MQPLTNTDQGQFGQGVTQQGGFQHHGTNFEQIPTPRLEDGSIRAIDSDPAFEMVDTWNTEGLGEIRVFAHKTQNLFKLQKKLDLSRKYGASLDEVNLLEIRLKELPQEVTLAAGNYKDYDPSQPIFRQDNQGEAIYLDYSSHNLRKHVLELKRQGLRVSVQEGLGYFGFLMGLGSFMEQGLEFHRSVCLKNLLIMENEGLQLMNPYVSDNHIRVVIEEYIRPILALGERWVPQMFVDERLRAEAAKSDPGVRNLNSSHRKHIKQMHNDCCLTFLSLATTEEESAYVSSSGVKNPAAIERGIQAMLDMGYPWEVINILRTILLPKTSADSIVPDFESVPTFIEINETISPELRELLMNSILSSKQAEAAAQTGIIFTENQHREPHLNQNLMEKMQYMDQTAERSKQESSAFIMDNSPFLFR